MYSKNLHKIKLLGLTALFLTLTFSGASFFSSLIAPPAYAAPTANAWNLERVSTDLNFYFSNIGNPIALQLNQGGDLRARKIYDLDSVNYFIDPSNTTTSLTVAGNVGIGTTAPLGKLHVIANGEDGLLFYNPSNDNFGLQTTLNNQPNNGYGGNANILSLQPVAGRVGIGTTAPVAPLNVVGSSSTSYGVARFGHSNLTQAVDIGHSGIQKYSNNGYNDLLLDGQSSGNLLLQTVATGNVGIGTTGPTQKLHVAGNVLATMFIDSDNQAYIADPANISQFQVLRRNYGYNGQEADENDGSYYVDPNGSTKLNKLNIVGIDCFYACNSVNGFLRYTPNVHLNTAQNYGFYVNWDNAPNQAPNSIYPFNVGNGAGGHLFYVRGDGRVWSAGDFAAAGVWYSSDERLKKNIHPLSSPLEKILALNGVNFQWDRSKHPERTANLSESMQLGFVAQQVEKAVPEVVETDQDGFKQVSYGNLTALLVEGVKEQQKQITDIRDIEEKGKQVDETQQQEINLLKQQVNMLKAEIEILKKSK